MTQRSWKMWLLAMLLAFAQQLSSTHVFEHTADWQQQASSQHTKSTLKVCGVCLALSGMHNAVGSSPLVFAPTQAVQQWFSVAGLSHSPLFVSHYQSRAPPVLA
ncbi:MAG TPA: hypothetical protein VFX23_12705 [Limnobacter sp.]|uniref:hypothetical protein n=1 Tax=Limnobacter sp. TaxID=2003368 RepID=UPI002E371C2F|nr:hypothetical protein [Limnobacter sp.]HEX5486844.1 hypothetical protein [Limnobacter sp.]